MCTRIDNAPATSYLPSHLSNELIVAIARSGRASFATALEKADGRIDGVASTAGFASRLDPADEAQGPPPGDLPNSPVADADTFTPFQWDMRQIHTPQAHAITRQTLDPLTPAERAELIGLLRKLG